MSDAPPEVRAEVGAALSTSISADAEVFALRGIRKRFGFREILRGIDWVGRQGSCSVVIGPNGAGKSTLLRILAGGMRPSNGSGHVAGRDLRRDSAGARARLGAVFHQSFLRPEMTLDENLRFYAKLYGTGDEERVSSLVEELGLARRRGDPLRTFSQGMVQRANLVRSLLHEPELWILDEPFSGLDPSGREVLSGLLRRFIGSGRAAVLVTHDLDLGYALATDLYRVEDGRLSKVDLVTKEHR